MPAARDFVQNAPFLSMPIKRSQLFTRRVINDSCTLYGAQRSAIELPGGVNDSSCHEKVDYSCFSALSSGDGAGFLRERFRR